jgi:hypothetical protein
LYRTIGIPFCIFSKRWRASNTERRELKNNIQALSRVGFTFDLPSNVSLQAKVEIPQVPEYLAKFYKSPTTDNNSDAGPSYEDPKIQV